MKIASLRPTTRVIQKATLPRYTITLSVKKKTVFASVVGCFIVFAIILLLDLINPLILGASDFRQIGVKAIGPFKLATDSCYSRLAAILMNMRADSAGNQAQTIVFAPIFSGFNLTQFTTKLADKFIKHGMRVGLVQITSQNDGIEILDAAPERESNVLTIDPEEVPYSLRAVLQRMQRKFDWVFVMAPHYDSSISAAAISRNSDAVFVLTKIGTSKLESVRLATQVGHSHAENTGVLRHASHATQSTNFMISIFYFGSVHIIGLAIGCFGS